MLNSLTFKRNIVKNLSIIFVSLIYASFSYASKNYLYNTDLNELDLSKTVRVLAIDGGGLRGIIPARILADIEEKLTIEFNRSIRICDCFDIIAGTSTGGIIALALNVPDRKNPNRPKYEAKKLVELYDKKKKEIFPQDWNSLNSLMHYFSLKYDAKPLEEILKEYFEEYELKKALTRTLITTYDLYQSKPFLLDSKKANDFPTDNYLMRDAARATSAAPTYLSAVDVKDSSGFNHTFIDGGISTNNPTWKAFEVALKDYPDREHYFIVSLGTGSTPPANICQKLSKGSKLDWAPYVASMMIDSASHLVDSTMREYATVSPKKVFYNRLQTQLPPDAMLMDNTQDDNTNKLLAHALGTLSAPEYKDVIQFLLYYFEKVKGYPRRQNNNISRTIAFNQEVALSLNGINQYAELSEISNTLFALGQNPFTIEIEIKTTDKELYRHIFRLGVLSTGHNKDYVIALSQGKVIFGSCDIGWSEAGNDSLADDKWHKISLVRNKFSQIVYIDGVEKGQSNKFSPNIIGGKLRIGAHIGESLTEYGAKLFLGFIRNFRFWNIARSLSEIQNDLTSKEFTSSNNLIAYWSFKEGDKDNVHDLSGNKYDLDLINEPVRVGI